MNEFQDNHFEQKLLNLKDTQESIQSLSFWCLKHQQHYKKIVSSWLHVMKKVRIEQRVTLFYLANDVIQYSKRKGLPFVDNWATALQKATPLVREDKVKKKILRLFKIWGERSVYDEAFLSDLCGLLTATTKRNLTTAELIQDFQPTVLFSKIRKCKLLEDETDLKLKVLKESHIPVDDPDALQMAVKDRENGDELLEELGDAIAKLESYTKSLEVEIKERIGVIKILEISEQFYETQRGEAKVVCNAYRNFAYRVKMLKKKLEESIDTLPSPIPSPDINAPSPTSSVDDIPEPPEEKIEENLTYDTETSFIGTDFVTAMQSASMQRKAEPVMNYNSAEVKPVMNYNPAETKSFMNYNLMEAKPIANYNPVEAKPDLNYNPVEAKPVMNYNPVEANDSMTEQQQMYDPYSLLNSYTTYGDSSFSADSSYSTSYYKNDTSVMLDTPTSPTENVQTTEPFNFSSLDMFSNQCNPIEVIGGPADSGGSTLNELLKTLTNSTAASSKSLASTPPRDSFVYATDTSKGKEWPTKVTDYYWGDTGEVTEPSVSAIPLPKQDVDDRIAAAPIQSNLIPLTQSPLLISESPVATDTDYRQVVSSIAPPDDNTESVDMELSDDESSKPRKDDEPLIGYDDNFTTAVPPPPTADVGYASAVDYDARYPTWTDSQSFDDYFQSDAVRSNLKEILLSDVLEQSPDIVSSLEQSASEIAKAISDTHSACEIAKTIAETFKNDVDERFPVLPESQENDEPDVAEGQKYDTTEDQRYDKTEGNEYADTGGQKYVDTDAQKYVESEFQNYVDTEGQEYADNSVQMQDDAAHQETVEETHGTVPKINESVDTVNHNMDQEIITINEDSCDELYNLDGSELVDEDQVIQDVNSSRGFTIGDLLNYIKKDVPSQASTSNIPQSMPDPSNKTPPRALDLSDDSDYELDTNLPPFRPLQPPPMALFPPGQSAPTTEIDSSRPPFLQNDSPPSRHSDISNSNRPPFLRHCSSPTILPFSTPDTKDAGRPPFLRQSSSPGPMFSPLKVNSNRSPPTSRDRSPSGYSFSKPDSSQPAFVSPDSSTPWQSEFRQRAPVPFTPPPFPPPMNAPPFPSLLDAPTFPPKVGLPPFSASSDPPQFPSNLNRPPFSDRFGPRFPIRPQGEQFAKNNDSDRFGRRHSNDHRGSPHRPPFGQRGAQRPFFQPNERHNRPTPYSSRGQMRPFRRGW